MLLTQTNPGFYFVMAVSVGIIVGGLLWRVPVADSRDQQTSARRIVLTVAAGAFWPGAVILAAVCQFSSGQKLVRLLIGAPSSPEQ